MDKNPFSLYDFLGYVMPGAFALIIMWIILHSEPTSVYDFITVDDSLMNLIQVRNLIVLVIVSYVLGHLISFLSSIIIEKFAIWCYGYPSKYLLKGEVPKSEYFSYIKKTRGNLSTGRVIILSLWKGVLILLLLPISLYSFLIGRLCRLNHSVIKPLDMFLRSTVVFKREILLKHLGIVNNNYDNQNTARHDVDSLRVIYHYQYEKNNKQSKKMDNY